VDVVHNVDGNVLHVTSPPLEEWPGNPMGLREPEGRNAADSSSYAVSLVHPRSSPQNPRTGDPVR
jgi:hypothetical protein